MLRRITERLSRTQEKKAAPLTHESRRNFLIKASLSSLFLGASYWKKNKIANWLGETVDKKILDTDSYGADFYTPLLPAESFETEQSKSKKYPEKETTITLQANSEGKLECSLPQIGSFAVGVHSTQFYHTTEKINHTSHTQPSTFTESGWATITTKNGIKNGKQEYCALFQSKSGINIAIGYEGGLYTYNSSEKFWEQLKVTDSSAHPSVLIQSGIWDQITAHHKRKAGLIAQQTEQGNQTLIELGYKPAPGVLPTIKMPWQSVREFGENEQLYSTDEAVETMGHEKLFIAESGAIVDAKHLYGNIVQTLSVFLQVLYQYQVSKQNEKVKVAIPHWAGGEKSYIQLETQVSNFPENKIPSLVFHLMNTASHELESTSQRGLLDNMPVSIGILESTFQSGFAPEDMYSNTVGITYTIDAVKTQLMQKVLASPPPKDLSTPEAIFEYYHSEIEELAKSIFSQAITDLGIRTDIKLTSLSGLPLGLQPFIPTLATTDVKKPVQLPTEFVTGNSAEYQITKATIPSAEFSFLKLADKLP